MLPSAPVSMSMIVQISEKLPGKIDGQTKFRLMVLSSLVHLCAVIDVSFSWYVCKGFRRSPTFLGHSERRLYSHWPPVLAYLILMIAFFLSANAYVLY